MREYLSVLLLVTILGSTLSASFAEQPGAQVQDLKTLSLEELMQIDVTTVSRGSERRINAPAAVSVITGEDIRRHGVDTLADALRLADSVAVSRFNGGSWAIATRGFSATTNNKLLVMIDGRSVYTQLFGGMFWEAQHSCCPTSSASRSSAGLPERCGVPTPSTASSMSLRSVRRIRRV